MADSQDVQISDAPQGERERLLPILEESFEGLYLWHSRRTLQSIELVRAARLGEEDVGVAMLKMIAEHAGYVYYIAVSNRFRGRSIGGKLLDNALSYFDSRGADEVYASVEDDNVESKRLFLSRGFVQTAGGALAEKYGRVRAFLMSREMMLVPGEILLRKELRSAGALC